VIGLFGALTGNNQVAHIGQQSEAAASVAQQLGTIKFDLKGRHSSLAHVAWNQNGLAYKYDEYKQKFGRP